MVPGNDQCGLRNEYPFAFKVNVELFEPADMLLLLPRLLVLSFSGTHTEKFLNANPSAQLFSAIR